MTETEEKQGHNGLKRQRKQKRKFGMDSIKMDNEGKLTKEVGKVVGDPRAEDSSSLGVGVQERFCMNMLSRPVASSYQGSCPCSEDETPFCNRQHRR
mmetsp:Transcript_22357/g.38375  ORF Transcript_22357/g.38375 Transcript_22357/m.38375 type:complete len:97 (+) Transcript_22357:112-402(+)